ncbi:hypothetical protein RHSIM_Rhsim03G0018500 [Rhododendron simsii]|uniref:Uncharacterized protein n=1 Tax=Rhododendron simsii TaxID=118357 RepID=A0A834H5B4_RHOSS|nr:hypothetical protein RHSIM_Rhsim03G0018500 [Rhododendron simsii]
MPVWEFDQDHQRWLPVAELALPGEKGDPIYAVAWAPNIGLGDGVEHQWNDTSNHLRRHPHFVYQHCLPPPPGQISIAVISLNPTCCSVSDLKDIGPNVGVLSGLLYSADRMLPPLDGPCSMAMRVRRRLHQS